jgi:glyoxylase I family protein
MQKITGLGGVFFRSKDPVALGKWYEDNFGINAMSETSTEVWRQQAGPTVFAPFNHDTDYYPTQQQFMFNFRVENMEAMLEQLKKNGVKIDDNKMEDKIGKFAWVYDPEGNKIELWEPSNHAK